eukprot:scaffold84498_cov13-Tisochrysis_lutea.AAC.1
MPLRPGLPRRGRVANILSSSFADGLLGGMHTIRNLVVQAHQVTLYTDWAALISGSKSGSQ